jgi:MFS family permease
LLAVCGVLVLFTPDFAAGLIEAIIGRHPVDQPIPAFWQKADPVVGSALIFLLPCLALAMLSPCMIRVVTRNLAQVGRSSGFIIAAGTIGSIAGVFVSGFILIDQMRVSSIFRLTGGLTIALGVVYFTVDKWAWLHERSRSQEPFPHRLPT